METALNVWRKSFATLNFGLTWHKCKTESFRQFQSTLSWSFYIYPASFLIVHINTYEDMKKKFPPTLLQPNQQTTPVNFGAIKWQNFAPFPKHSLQVEMLADTQTITHTHTLDSGREWHLGVQLERAAKSKLFTFFDHVHFNLFRFLGEMINSSTVHYWLFWFIFDFSWICFRFFYSCIVSFNQKYVLYGAWIMLTILKFVYKSLHRKKLHDK